jgi:hypothetical protein
MSCRRFVLTALLVLGVAHAVAAQGQGNAAPATVDVNRLPINLERIQRKLRQTAVREERNGLNLSYVVEVYGQSPPIQFFAPREDLRRGPVPYGAPTHRQMIEAVTPQEHRAPAADLGALFGLGRKKR